MERRPFWGFLACLLGSFATVGEARATTPSLAEQAATEAEFLRGLALLDGGRPDVAIPKFSAILADGPGLVRVRVKLVRAYFAAGRWRQSR